MEGEEGREEKEGERGNEKEMWEGETRKREKEEGRGMRGIRREGRESGRRREEGKWGGEKKSGVGVRVLAQTWSALSDTVEHQTQKQEHVKS